MSCFVETLWQFMASTDEFKLWPLGAQHISLCLTASITIPMMYSGVCLLSGATWIWEWCGGQSGMSFALLCFYFALRCFALARTKAVWLQELWAYIFSTI